MDTPTRSEAIVDDEIKDLVNNFDHHCPAFGRRFREVFSYMHAQCPVLRSQNHGGYWVFTQYAHLQELARHPGVISNTYGPSHPPAPIPRLIPTFYDPPELTHYRRILNPLLSPQVVEAKRADIRKLAWELVEQAVSRGKFDVIGDVSRALTGRITCQMLEIEESKYEIFVDFVHMATCNLGTPEQVGAAYAKFRAEVLLAMEQHRHRTSGIIGSLFAARIDGRELSDEEVELMVTLILIGGLDTTQSVIGNSMVFLARNPDKRKEVLDDLSRLPTAVEELIRLFTPTQMFARMATQDFEAGEIKLAAGDKMIIAYGAANIDPAVFPDPLQADLRRNPNRHMSFGAGPHRCLGAPLARAEIIECLNALLRCAPDFRVVEEELHAVEDIASIYSYHSVPIVVLNAAAPA